MPLSDDKIKELLAKPKPFVGSTKTRVNFRDLSSLNELWIAWAAGFIDGEGAIMIVKSTRQVALQMYVTQKKSEPLLKLEEMFGGSLEYSDKRDIYGWRIYGEAATRCLRVIRPYLLVKGEHADIAIEFQEVCFGTGVPFSAKLEYYERMKPLQRKRNHAND